MASIDRLAARERLTNIPRSGTVASAQNRVWTQTTVPSLEVRLGAMEDLKADLQEMLGDRFDSLQLSMSETNKRFENSEQRLTELRHEYCDFYALVRGTRGAVDGESKDLDVVERSRRASVR